MILLDLGVIEVLVLYLNNVGFFNFFSLKWYDLISGVEDVWCN